MDCIFAKWITALKTFLGWQHVNLTWRPTTAVAVRLNWRLKIWSVPLNVICRGFIQMPFKLCLLIYFLLTLYQILEANRKEIFHLGPKLSWISIFWGALHAVNINLSKMEHLDHTSVVITSTEPGGSGKLVHFPLWWCPICKDQAFATEKRVRPQRKCAKLSSQFVIWW